MTEALRHAARRRADAKERIALGIAAGFSFALGGGVLCLLIYLLLLLVTIAGARPAIAQSGSSTPGIMLQSGIEKEDVDGDLKGAMSIYEKIAADASAPREVRAKALLRLAGCDEKLGKQAKQLYEQIVREYADQPAATQARTRLAAIRQQEHPAAPETMSVHKVEREKLGYFGPGDTDGHRVTYIASDGNLYIGDISGHAKSLVYGPSDPEFRKSPSWVVSRDFSVVALALPKTKTRPVTLAVVKTDGTGYRELLHDDEQGNILGGNHEFLVRWSWDDRTLLVHNPRSKDACSRLWLVSVADGKQRELVHEESTKCIQRPRFSPDGQFAAYEVRPIWSAPQGVTSKVFVVPIQGGEPRLVYESDPWRDNTGLTDPFEALADWTADGRYLAIKGIHEGMHALFLLPIKNGLAAGSPVFVRVGNFEDAGSTSSGALIFEDRSSSHYSWQLASIDLDGKIGKWSPIELGDRRPFSYAPSFSPDASQIAFTSRNPHSTSADLIIKDISSGRERVVYQSDADYLTCGYSANRPVVFCTNEKLGVKTDLVSVSVESGAVEHIETFPDSRYLLQSPQDDKVFYFVSEGPLIDTEPKIRWDRSTQKESAVADPAEVRDYRWTPSLDGRWVLRQRDGDLSFRPTAGGEWKTLVSGIENANMLGSTPDGNWALYFALDPQGNPGIYEAPFWGGEPRRVADLPGNHVVLFNDFDFSPDGRKILAHVFNSPEDDLWILENFEPKTSK
jgi:Tol biopolymer transport system component